ncbi:hypothetical protein B0A58_00855 [Flavobacterium branchiophilum NBRC 15030 = ATCC 35035]|uniref:Porin n=1 Tax=Flavobacterium branchiophilum TaxID=55197 RepID=A0A543G8A7_9FLAO|nr:hypothetical protein [Flavobacterium branchiophilum]OXA81908.1 hypothetical protein B0A58_00855 [Flavobacterium branchiophilum NBRC 15030 = ATCC 35035]TQM42313.1 hypothetical protein BC670_3363 [Flavobacterium branchiophilum]GEM54740.1 hypothetical protein FB1_09610 [Flavobacterium branchiophilum NBRC 15030 = ATCC 35035]
MKKRYLVLLAGLASLKGISQTAPAATAAAPAANDYSLSWYGFVRTDYIWDTRKSAQVREDHLNLYPLDESINGGDGKDANAVGQSNFLSVVSRLGVKAKGPDVWGAKVSATLEGDFFGNFENAAANSSSVGLLRLRHAYAQLDWKKTSLTMGQTWYPTFIPEVFPGVANFSTGIMFNPFGWASQVRLKQSLSKDVAAVFTAYKEREFTISGPGTQNSASINSALPSLNAQLQYKNKNLFLGAGIEYKSLQPRTDNGLTGTSKMMTTKKANSTTFYGYGKYANDKITIKAYGISGGNMFNMVMLGGYIGSTTNGIETYEATKATAFWIDIASNGKSVAPGLFFGTTKNNGADNAGTVAYGRGIGVNGARMVDNVWRLSGRVDFKKNKFRISPELELTSADWGASDAFGKVTGATTSVSNFRTMLSCVYTF